ncbi:MAG: acetamidase/formamidase family protein [Gemmatimonadetes bacterium]|nr:acetamidase/formamidase family protein [Gemmatimonadota bacterium]
MAHHHFVPKTYHTAIGAHEPVLGVASGDTITTTTVDAGGSDATGKPITPAGNPQTGPFYLEGAEPGDTLAVTFDKLAPNRKIGYTSGVVAANVLDFGYTPEFDDNLDRILDWEIDFENNTATPVGFDDLPIGRLRIPLKPMVGCFGVAPPRGQAISTATSDTHGGNMDYREFVQGVTVYLPVFVEGGLFHIGDGHAVQGDGEIAGTGIEISFDVTFTLRLLKGKTINWPRAINETHVMAVGNARPLDQATQHATTELIRLLQEDYGLDTRSIHILMGQAVEYDVGNVYDPAYTMVCKMPIDILESIGASRQ